MGSWNGSAYTGIAGLIDAGRANGTWTGTGGIVTTSAAPADLTTLGIATAGSVQASAFAGLSLAANDVLVRYTWGGDANLDGRIDIDDYGQIDFNVAIPGASGWSGGDFNYDGKINIDDYGIIDFNVGAQTGSFPAGGVPEAAVRVPEPAPLGLLWITSLIRTRRRSVSSAGAPMRPAN